MESRTWSSFTISSLGAAKKFPNHLLTSLPVFWYELKGWRKNCLFQVVLFLRFSEWDIFCWWRSWQSGSGFFGNFLEPAELSVTWYICRLENDRLCFINDFGNEFDARFLSSFRVWTFLEQRFALSAFVRTTFSTQCRIAWLFHSWV